MTLGAEKLFADCARRRTRGLPLDGGSIPPISTFPRDSTGIPGVFCSGEAFQGRVDSLRRCEEPQVCSWKTRIQMLMMSCPPILVGASTGIAWLSALSSPLSVVMRASTPASIAEA